MLPQEERFRTATTFRYQKKKAQNKKKRNAAARGALSHRNYLQVPKKKSSKRKKKKCWRKRSGFAPQLPSGTQFACFTGTKVQILTKEIVVQKYKY
jgi:hypothetical protein